MKKTIAVFVLLMAVVTFAAADVYVKSKVHTDPVSMMGQNQPAQDMVSEQWIGNNQFATLSQKNSTVLDLGKNVLYIINNANKTYIEAPLPFEFSSILPAEMASMMQSMMKMTVTVAPTGQTKTVGQWSCKEYDVTMNMMMMPMKLKVYATAEVPAELKSFMEKAYATQLKATMRLDDAAVAEMAKIKGFWISSETTMEMMGSKIRSTSEVVEISQKTPPAGVYSVPAGYKKQDKLSMQDMQGK
ncbi:MAG: DUF4412 domain-containing protein [Candidatus Aminicenantales bacterium]